MKPIQATASIRKRVRKDNKAVFQLTVELPPDKLAKRRNRMYETFATKREAEQRKSEILTDLKRGTYYQSNPMTVSEWMEKWLRDYKLGKISPTTYATYETQINLYIKPCLGQLQLQDLENLTVQEWVNKIATASPSSGKPLSEKMLKNILANLRSAMDKAICMKIIPANPCVGVELKHGKKQYFETYSMEEIALLMRASKGTSLELGIQMELCLGLRRGELLAVRLSDIDWENNKINISKARVCVRGKVLEKETKTEAGNRVLDVPSQLMTQLKARKHEAAMQKLAAGAAFHEDPFIISKDALGSPYFPNYYSQMFQKFLLANHLRKIEFHKLRHVNASLMAAQGVQPKTIQARLGHEDAKFSLDVYTHAMAEPNREAAQKIGDAVYQTQAL